MRQFALKRREEWCLIKNVKLRVSQFFTVCSVRLEGETVFLACVHSSWAGGDLMASGVKPLVAADTSRAKSWFIIQEQPLAPQSSLQR
ncbi:Endoglucanase 1 [Clarias magur]|uniref:Endoglucanase 1 n=1 Tax=Clarias magur TaxID=1594786 RepID=A0A8J5BNR2_CLAMG|nr:Endoglucanase 1 [Clarias magur]